MGDLAWAACNMSFPDCLECVHPLRILLSDLHHFPELPFPITLSRSNASIVRGSLRNCLKSIFRWKEPEPLVAVYHWSVACCSACQESAKRWKEEGTYNSFENRRQVDSRHKQIIAMSSCPCTAAAVRKYADTEILEIRDTSL